MTRGSFFKGLGALFVAPKLFTEIDFGGSPLTKTVEIAKSSGFGFINKCYVSAIDPILDTREINRLIEDVYNEDDFSAILNTTTG